MTLCKVTTAAVMCLLLSCAATASAQRSLPARPALQLHAPRYDQPQGESFERSTSDEVQRTGQSLRQLLAQQLSSAVEPLATGPLLLTRRPGIVAPLTPAVAAVRFAGDAQDTSDDYSDEITPAEEEEQLPLPQPQQPTPLPVSSEEEYNPFRDNFYDRNADGSYVFGYSLPNGVRRYERSYYSEEQHGQVVEGFYTEARHTRNGVSYELRCYRADVNGYQPLNVEYLPQAPRVRRNEQPNVDCFGH